jgi:RNA polymerase sigma-70 factor (ECF subfamily)
MIRDLPGVFSRVRAALMRRGRSEQDAEDFVQEAWVRLTEFQSSHRVDRPEAFLMKTALNLSIDNHRASVVRGEQLMLEHVVIVDATPGVEDVLLRREQLARLNQCLAHLSDRTRDMLLEHRMEGMTYQQIADKHGVTISTVHKHIGKALLVLANAMQGWYP